MVAAGTEAREASEAGITDTRRGRTVVEAEAEVEEVATEVVEEAASEVETAPVVAAASVVGAGQVRREVSDPLRRTLDLT